jgi:hypothetical protein
VIPLWGKDGKPEISDHGFWEVVGGTGTFKALKGAGTRHTKSVSPTNRCFKLERERLLPQQPSRLSAAWSPVRKR